MCHTGLVDIASLCSEDGVMRQTTTLAHVGLRAARKLLPKLLRRVEAGEEIVIRRGGRPVAKLVPFTDEGEPTATQPDDYRHGLHCVPTPASMTQEEIS